MRNKIFLMMSVVGLLCSCEDQKKKEQAQRTSDSLRTELQANRKLTEAMVEIGSLIDSIDVNRKMLRVKMVEGTNYETFAGRMRDINRYVHNAETKIAALEKAAAKN